MATSQGLGALASARPTAFGEVYLADDSHVSQNLKAALGFITKGARPVVVVQSQSNSPEHRGIVLVCPVTTGRVTTAFDLMVKAGDGGLRETSLVQVSFVFPIPKTALTQKIGELGADSREALKARLARVLGLI